MYLQGVLNEKLIVPQLVKLPSFYVFRWIIMIIRIFRSWTLS
jgi:hypothetical protein